MKKTTKINAFKAFINLQSTKTQADFKKARMVQSLKSHQKSKIKLNE